MDSLMIFETMTLADEALIAIVVVSLALASKLKNCQLNLFTHQLPVTNIIASRYSSIDYHKAVFGYGRLACTFARSSFARLETSYQPRRQIQFA